jgi:thiol-disulfide isomerase/thioredoxin
VLRRLLLAAALVALVAPAAAQLQQANEPAAGRWRAWLDTPGGELPFGIEFSYPDDVLSAHLVNGEERIPVLAFTRDAGAAAPTVVLSMPHYDSEITARITGSGRSLDGEWRKTRGPGKEARVLFHARAGETERFAREQEFDLEDGLGGRWSVRFASDELPAVAEFTQYTSGRLRGTFLTATGDYRYLAGHVDGEQLALSCFDGAHAFLFRATRQPDGSLAGDFWSGNWWHETWTATPAPDAALPDPFAQTSRTDTSLAALAFPDLDGELRNLADPDLSGRATLVQLFGSWCPNCHDETAYLVELDRRYRERGLRIVGLAFELTGDFERSARQVKRFAARHRVKYPLLIAGTADKGLASQAFPAVDRVRSYPTTILLHGDGRVRAVHSGWSGPATGEAHVKLRADMESLIEELLAEEHAGDDATWDLLTARTWFDVSAFAGGTVTFGESDTGRRQARVVRFGSGVPVTSDEVLRVALRSDAVRIGERVWRLDREATVLLDPTDAGVRLVPHAGGALPQEWEGDVDPTPLLTRLGLDARAALGSDDPRARREAAFAGGHERRDAEDPCAAELLPRLDDTDLEVRCTAAWALGRRRELSAAARERLTALGSHPYGPLRREAARALERH